MTDFLFFVLSPTLLTVAAITLRRLAVWQVCTTVVLGLVLLLAINGVGGSYQGWQEMIGGFLMDIGPILAVALFLLATRRKGGQRPGLLVLGVPVSYFLGFALGVQIGMLLGWVQP